MIRVLPWRERALAQQLPLAVSGAVWLLACARTVEQALDHPGKLTIALALVCMALPFALLQMPRIPIYLLGAYAVLVPFSSILVTPAGNTITKLLGMAVGASLVLAMIARRRVMLPSRATLVVIALTVYAGLSIFWAIDPVLAFSSYGMYLSYIGLYVAIALYPASEGETRFVVLSTVAGGLFAAAYGAYFFWHGQHVYDYRLALGDINTNWLDPNEYAATLLTPIAIVLLAFLATRSPLLKAAWLGALVLLAYAFAASGSRGGMIALGAMLLYILVRSRHRIQLLAMLPVLVIALIGSPIGHRLLQPDTLSADLRTDIWKVGFASLQQYWLAGAGIGNFTNAYTQYYLSTPHAAVSWDRVAHSVIVQGAVEFGIGGLLLMLGVWYTQFSQLRTLRRYALTPDLPLALEAGVVGLFVAGLSLSLLLTKYTWLLFAVIALTRSAYLNRAAEPAAPRPAPQI